MTKRRLGQLAAIVLVFVTVGPVIGLLAAAALAGLAIAAGGDPGGGGAFTIFLLIYGLLFAHFIGIVPAAMAGTIVAGVANWRGRVPLAFGAVAGIAGMGLMALRSGVPQPSWRESSTTAVAVIWLLAHVLAALACTRLTRRWQ